MWIQYNLATQEFVTKIMEFDVEIFGGITFQLFSVQLNNFYTSVYSIFYTGIVNEKRLKCRLKYFQK